MNLFDAGDQQRRDRLRHLGWQWLVTVVAGGSCWRRPDGVILDEPEAFRQLERIEQQHEGKRGEYDL